MTSDPFWLLGYSRAEMERLAADTTRKLDEAVAATSWSTTAALDAATLSRATAQEDLEYFARLAGSKCEHSREWYSVMCVPGVRHVEEVSDTHAVRAWVAAGTTDTQLAEIEASVRERVPATVRVEVRREENPDDDA